MKTFLRLLATSGLVVVLAACGRKPKPARNAGYGAPPPSGMELLGGGGPSAPTPAPAQTKVATVTNVGELYSTINKSDCLVWPSPETKRLGGADAWAGWYPKNGMSGVVLGSSPHCSKPGVPIYIIDFGGGHIAAIGGPGVSLSNGGAAPPPTVQSSDGATVRIVSPGKAYDLINTTDCLTWPSPSAKAVGGQSGWGGWKVKSGDVGEVVGKTKHCNQPTTVVFVKIGARYLAIDEAGVQYLSGSSSSVPWIGASGGTKPYTPPSAPVSKAGAGTVDSGRVRFVDVDEVYSSINKSSCLQWPDEDVKAEAGMSAWGSWRPKNGETGVVLGKSNHCDKPQVVVLIVRTDSGHLVAIGITGVAPE